jgi:hypothetical protein
MPSIIDRLRSQHALASTRPWEQAQAGTRLPAGAVQIGHFEQQADALLALDSCNHSAKLIELYAALKAYQPRMAQGRAPLAAQRTRLNAALAALEQV